MQEAEAGKMTEGNQSNDADEVSSKALVDDFQSESKATNRLRDSYLKFLRKVAPNRASRVRLPVGEIAQRVEWSKGRGSLITEIPKIENPSIEVADIYPVVEPYSYVRVTFNKETSEYILEMIEPALTEKEEKLLNLIKDTMKRTLGYEWDKLTQLDKGEYLTESVESYIKSRGVRIDPLVRKKIGYYIARDFVGYGKVDALIRDEKCRGHLVRWCRNSVVRLPQEV